LSSLSLSSFFATKAKLVENGAADVFEVKIKGAARRARDFGVVRRFFATLAKNCFDLVVVVVVVVEVDDDVDLEDLVDVDERFDFV
jgi:hypothetical protein